MLNTRVTSEVSVISGVDRGSVNSCPIGVVKKTIFVVDTIRCVNLPNYARGYCVICPLSTIECM